MENNIKITIITVSYNSVNTIVKTIWSIINQTYKNIEYIVIDGESNDGTLDIIKKYQERISCWISEKDYGIYDAMNKGIDLATGDYVYFIGSDDWLVNFNIIEKVVSYLEINQSIDILSGQVWNVYEKFGLQKIFHNKFDKNMIENGYCIPHQGTFVKTAHIKN